MATNTADPLVGTRTGTESSLSSWAGPYVTDMLGRGAALASTPYEAYTGPLTAGPTDAQQSAFSGVAGLALPDAGMTSFTPQSFTDEGVADSYMNPYLRAALEPQLAEARRQAEIARVNQAGRLTRAGAYGGGRQAVMESELTRNLLRNLADITGRGYSEAFQQGRSQFNTEEDRRLASTEGARRYGIDALTTQANLGEQERRLNQSAVDAAREQFDEERLFPYRQIQFQQSLLDSLPLATQNYTYQQPGFFSELSGGASGILDLLRTIGFGGGADGDAPEAGSMEWLEDILSGF